MMYTKITELFGIRYPILLSGMSWISTPEIAAAVSNSGGLGILATGAMNAYQTREAIKKTRILTSKPFGANMTLYYPGAKRNADTIIEEEVPVVNYTPGKGDWICKRVHEYGGKVIATVTTLKHALNAQLDGADAVIVTSHEAAGYDGDMTSLILIPSIANKLNIPVIAAGGFADGRGLISAFTLGAEGISIDTGFMNTIESPAHEYMKRMLYEKDTFRALLHSRATAIIPGYPWVKMIVSILLRKYKTCKTDVTGTFPPGQVRAIKKDLPSVEAVIKQIISDSEKAVDNVIFKVIG